MTEKRIWELSVRIDDDLWQRINDMVTPGVSRSDVVRSLLLSGLVTHETARPGAGLVRSSTEHGDPIRRFEAPQG